jgi:hypothetical protein
MERIEIYLLIWIILSTIFIIVSIISIFMSFRNKIDINNLNQK